MMSGVQIAIEITKRLDVMYVKAIASFAAYLAGVIVALANGTGNAPPMRSVIINDSAHPVDVDSSSHPGADGGRKARARTKPRLPDSGEIHRNIVGAAAPFAYTIDSMVRRLPFAVTCRIAEVAALCIATTWVYLFRFTALLAVNRDPILRRWISRLPGRLALFVAERLGVSASSIRLSTKRSATLGARRTRRLRDKGTVSLARADSGTKVGSFGGMICLVSIAALTANQTVQLTPPSVSDSGGARLRRDACQRVIRPLKPCLIIP